MTGFLLGFFPKAGGIHYITTLNESSRRRRKRIVEIDCPYISVWGDLKKPIYGLSQVDIIKNHGQRGQI